MTFEDPNSVEKVLHEEVWVGERKVYMEKANEKPPKRTFDNDRRGNGNGGKFGRDRSQKPRFQNKPSGGHIQARGRRIQLNANANNKIRFD